MSVTNSLASPFLSCVDRLHTATPPSAGTALKVLGAVGAVFMGYRMIKKICSTAQNALDRYIITHASDALVLALSLDNLKLSPEELTKKAQLLQMRKDVLSALNNELSTNKSLTPGQKNNLQNFVKIFNPLFVAVDTVRPNLVMETNPDASLLGDVKNSIVKKQIIQSILLNLKPNLECSNAELNRKEKLTARRTEILRDAKTKTSNPKIQAFISLLEAAASSDYAKTQEAAKNYLHALAPNLSRFIDAAFPWKENGGALLKAMLDRVQTL